MFFYFVVFIIPSLPYLYLTRGFAVNKNKMIFPAFIFGFSALFCMVHYIISYYNAVKTLSKQLSMQVPDPEDEIHKVLLNVVEEIHIVTGGKKKMRPMVIPTMSLNALAVTDIAGDSVIGITEGLLARLSREELEAVIAHEAYHILSGDCRETTLAVSLFGIYAGMLEGLEKSKQDSLIYFDPAAFGLRVLIGLSRLMNMFISRQRELRADAGAVRMTRNPLALASALNVISKNWTGAGIISEGIEMLCITPPVHGKEIEEGWWERITSTHPPAGQRIDVLLRMAYATHKDIEKKEIYESVDDVSVEKYHTLDNMGQWQGPFLLDELLALRWILPTSKIKKHGSDAIFIANFFEPLKDVFIHRIQSEHKEIAALDCPFCRQPLYYNWYEGVKLSECHSCGGVLLEGNKLPRIFARQSSKFGKRLQALARAVALDNQKKVELMRKRQRLDEMKSVLKCPKCGRLMFRTFYSMGYPIVIDKCNSCEIVWLDTDELEILQYLIENKLALGYLEK